MTLSLPDRIARAADRDKVISMQTRKDFPLITEKVPAVTVLKYHSLGMAVSDVSASTAFYGKLGFEPTAAADGASASPIRVLRSSAGKLYLHLIPAVPLVDGKNLLMDYPTSKPPGHTHASWSVPSVPAVKSLLDTLGVPLSGTRSTLAVFVRDLDRTTLEFERNDGGDEPPLHINAHMIGHCRPMDHVGIR